MEKSCGIRGHVQPYALTVVRLVLGIIFLMHGSQKVLGLFGGGGLAATVQGMTQMGMPALLAYVVSFTEFLGGIALLFGLLTRLAALGIMIDMIGAIATVHGKNGFFINWFLKPGVGHGYEYNLALISMSLALILGGSGPLAVDNFCCNKKETLA